MPKSRPPYPAAFRQQMVELVRSGRTPGELAREFEPSAEADRDAGKRSDGLRAGLSPAILRQLARRTTASCLSTSIRQRVRDSVE